MSKSCTWKRIGWVRTQEPVNIPGIAGFELRYGLAVDGGELYVRQLTNYRRDKSYSVFIGLLHPSISENLTDAKNANYPLIQIESSYPPQHGIVWSPTAGKLMAFRSQISTLPRALVKRIMPSFEHPEQLKNRSEKVKNQMESIDALLREQGANPDDE